MPISITTNFDVNRSAPIDSRLVATDSNARNAIVFKYPGLKVFQLDDNKTYVYNTSATWSLDGGSVASGIYSGNGSLPSNVSVNFGTVSADVFPAANSTSKYLSFFAEDFNLFNQSQVLNYFYRNNTGGTWETMSYIIDHKLVNLSDNTTEQSGFIGFNYNTDYADDRGVVAIGSKYGSTPTEKFAHLLISPKDYTMFINNKQKSGSFTMGFEDNSSFLGVNYNPNLDSILYPNSQAIYPLYSSGRFRFTLQPNSEFAYQSRVKIQQSQTTDNTFEDVIVISNDNPNNDVSSNFKVAMDVSAVDWDPTLQIRNSQLITIDKFVRNTEHKYFKTQHWGQGTITWNDSTNTLILDDAGNSYDYTHNTTKSIKHIRLKRGSAGVTDFPEGSIITIRFFLSSSITNAYIELQKENEDPSLSTNTIFSTISDETFSSNSNFTLPPNNRRLSIQQNPNSKIGDIMTFKRIREGWTILNVDRQDRIVRKVWQTSASTNASITTATWSFTTVSYLNSFVTPYNFINITNASIDVIKTSPITPSLNRPPNSFIWQLGAALSTFREGIGSGDSFYLRIGVDGNRLVTVQGNFRINMSGLSTPLKYGREIFDDRPNVWRIGRINQGRLRPTWESTWTLCSGFFYDSVIPTDSYTLKDMYFSISTTGDIFVSYNLQKPINAPGTIKPILDVWVPPFSYTAPYSTITEGGSGNNTTSGN